MKDKIYILTRESGVILDTINSLNHALMVRSIMTKMFKEELFLYEAPTEYKRKIRKERIKEIGPLIKLGGLKSIL